MTIKLTDGKINRSRVVDPGRVVKGFKAKQAYERLRKRSYRRHLRYKQADADFWNGGPEVTDPWTILDHECYVQGVKDGIKEVLS